MIVSPEASTTFPFTTICCCCVMIDVVWMPVAKATSGTTNRLVHRTATEHNGLYRFDHSEKCFLF